MKNIDIDSYADYGIFAITVTIVVLTILPIF